MKLLIQLPPDQIQTAASLYAKAFQRKAVVIIGSSEDLQEILEFGIDPTQSICVLDDEEKLVGVAGHHLFHKSFLNFKLEKFQAKYGKIEGTFKFALVRTFFNRLLKKNQLLMDGIAVDESCRGKGVGTLLLNGIFEIARNNKMSSIRLDVIDENTRAKKLYTRLGFRPMRHLRTPFLKGLAGISGVTTMIKHLDG